MPVQHPVEAWVKVTGQAAIEEGLIYAAGRVAAGTPYGRALGTSIQVGRTIVQGVRLAHDLAQAPIDAMSDTMREVMRPVEEDIRESSPVDTGRLKRSVATEIDVKPSVNGPGLLLTARTGWIGKNPRRKVVQRVIEYGSRRGRKAQRVIRGAVGRQGTGLIGRLPSLLKGQVEDYIRLSMEERASDVVTIGREIAGVYPLRRLARGARFIPRRQRSTLALPHLRP